MGIHVWLSALAVVVKNGNQCLCVNVYLFEYILG